VDPRGFPTTLPEFQRVFPDDRACATYLERLRWPEGFACPKCGVVGEPYRFAARPGVMRCRSCKSNVSLTAGTAMQGTHKPLSIWFWASYLMTTQTPGQSALQLQRQLSLTRHETAWMILQKLRAGMVRPDRDPIGGDHPVEVDETLVGGRTRGEGRGKHHKIYVLGAVEVRTRKTGEDKTAAGSQGHKDGKPMKRRVYAGRLRLQVVSDRQAATCEGFVRDEVIPGSRVRTDGWQGYAGLTPMGYEHDGRVLTPEQADEHLPMVHLVFSNLKSWILGTHHGTSQQHLQAYLNEFCFRFNRRFYPMTAFNSVLGIAVKTVPPTYASLYSGVWEHPAGQARSPQVEMPFA
jgi:transposase-like protein